MSWQLRLLNRHLRWFEKPALARHDKDRLRRSFALKSRLYFHAPLGTSFERASLGGVPVQWARARGVRPAPVILYFHGGAYVFGTSTTHRAMLAKLSALTGLPACLPDYRLAPEHPFPAQIDDALACYRALRSTHEVIIGGDSAGGGLALALLHEILARGLVPPMGVFAFSPLTDVTYSGASVTENAARDCVLSATRIGEMLEMFLRGQDPRDPRASPLFGRFTGAPPVWMTVGDTEILRDDTLRMQAALVAQGVQSVATVKPDH
ncbi:MAG: alpha/beta hydrolase, partial [Roseovarius sp.]